MLRPSDAHLWVKCPLAGSVIVTGEYYVTHDPQNIYSGETDAQREGNCAHWAADLVFTGWVQHAGELIGISHPNGWMVDEEMAGHVQDYVDYVRSFGTVVASERSVQLYDLINGRLDTVVSSDAAVVRIFDLKYGWRIVEAEENYTMLCYGLAVAADRDVTVELHIFQPRPAHPDGPRRVWKLAPHEVIAWNMWMQDRARECFDNPQGKPGSHCTSCPARGSCHALAKNVFHAYEMVADDRMVNYSPAELGALLTFLHQAEDMVKAKLNGIETEVVARINRGTTIPRWAMETRKGNRRFTIPPERVRMVVGFDPVKTVPMSPAELERAGVPKEVVNQISERPVIGRKLTNNPENIAKRLFGNG